ncbi:MAG: hypothetical protein JRJ59_06530 [Deltaproteobacteria bacterium]|nr:hypothetical protein [Deltaproteobacteria bacterium]
MESGSIPPRPAPPAQGPPLLVVNDQRFSQHLENVFHLENAKRVRAFDRVLSDPQIKGKWLAVPPRMASEQELAWVHTPAHIASVAQTSGQPLTSFDLDTQTSEMSYEVARLAAGRVFALLEAVWANQAKQGFAFVRPPGHHAEPDRAMGFCLFNNVALGARYCQERLRAEKVMILDIDVHHGDGTQAAFYDTD